MISEWALFRVANGAVMASYLLGFVFYLLIDKPIRNIDRMVLFPTKISDSFLVKKNQRAAKKSNSFGEKQAKIIEGRRGGLLLQRSDGEEGGEEADEARDGPDNVITESRRESEVQDESQGSDDSEDETTVTFRKAAKYRAFLSQDSDGAP